MTRPPSLRIKLISSDELSVRVKARSEGASFSALITKGVEKKTLLKEDAESFGGVSALVSVKFRLQEITF